ncbi:hypothetical protein DAI22_02g162800 [Oryza sativa Japonica Group]|nr:hypothetical protein DAI22_02g162800 [Oryza sativa Japonica Group]
MRQPQNKPNHFPFHSKLYTPSATAEAPPPPHAAQLCAVRRHRLARPAPRTATAEPRHRRSLPPPSAARAERCHRRKKAGVFLLM